jgi:hypothetical protein
MEAMTWISLFSCIYLKLAKNATSFLISLLFSLQQNWRRGQNRFCLEARWLWGSEGIGAARRDRGKNVYTYEKR